MILYRRRFKRKHIPFQLLVIAGLYLLCGLGGLSRFGAGELFALLCAALLAGSLIFGEKALDNVDPVTLTALQTAASAGLAVLCSLVFEGGWHLEGADLKIWAIIVYLAILCTVAGYLLQNQALKSISSRTVALLQCACPVLTALFSRLLLGERLTISGTVGADIILFCVIGETLLKDEKQEISVLAENE